MTEQVYLLQVLLCHIPPLWQYWQYVQIQITGGNWMRDFLGFLSAVSLPCFGRSTFTLSRVIMFLSFSLDELHKFCKLCSCSYYTYCMSHNTKHTFAVFSKPHWPSSSSDIGAQAQALSSWKCRFVLHCIKCSWSWCRRCCPFSLEDKCRGRCQGHWELSANWHKLQVSKLCIYITMTSSPSTTLHKKNSRETVKKGGCLILHYNYKRHVQ